MKYTLRINGGTHEVDGEPGDSLLSVLRYDLGMTGSKYGCGEGFCGACTVLVDGETARSCMVRLGATPGKAITTIEGLAKGEKLHPVQEAFLETEAFQCGYCTPGHGDGHHRVVEAHARIPPSRTSPRSWTATSVAAAPTRASSTR